MCWKLQFLCQTFNIFISSPFIDFNLVSSHPSSSLYRAFPKTVGLKESLHLKVSRVKLSWLPTSSFWTDSGAFSSGTQYPALRQERLKGTWRSQGGACSQKPSSPSVLRRIYFWTLPPSPTHGQVIVTNRELSSKSTPEDLPGCLIVLKEDRAPFSALFPVVPRRRIRRRSVPSPQLLSIFGSFKLFIETPL